uniref:Rhodopsin-like n=1 Tax=Saccoglossus kowalevskii TaxID=10224 RepID=A0ABM0LZU9_SACKO|nr:PREDICTED: rhodopsin-like [Saccoglossus kowalevskii]
MSYVNISSDNTTDNSGNESIDDILFDVAVGFVGILGILGNAVVCVVFLKVKSLRTMTNMFILNQSLIDLSSSLIFILSYLGPTMDPLPNNITGTIFCKFWVSLYPLWSLFDSSSLNLVAITIERYFAIVHPVMHLNKFTMSGVHKTMRPHLGGGSDK